MELDSLDFLEPHSYDLRRVRVYLRRQIFRTRLELLYFLI